ncbi:MAG: pilus (MSHA type) biogenesis protein MshL [Pseudomonadota bacterium]|nr:pilus (MSHA type) biogenesis protein MshL [Pseudomonadota bacterium]
MKRLNSKTMPRAAVVALSVAMSLLLTSCAATAPKSSTEVVDEEKPTTQKLLVADAPSIDPRSLMPPVALPEKAEDRFDVTANRVPAAAFFNSLVDGTGLNMIVHPDVSGRITLNLKDVTVREALMAVRDVYGYDFNESAYGVQILPKAPQTRIFPINYLNVMRSGRSGMKVSSGMTTTDGEGSGVASSVFGEYDGSQVNSSEVETLTGSEFWKDLRSTLTLMMASEEGASVVVDAHAGLVIARAMPTTLAQVQRYLEQAELTVQKQVLIEAKIVEVTLSDGYQSGINWSTIAAQTGKNDVWATQSSESLNDPNILGGIFSLNVDAGNFSGALSLLETQGDVEVLSSPRIATVNNQKAVIKVGNDEYFVTDVTSTTTATVTGTSDTPEIELTPFFSGIALDVTPQIGDDEDITLHVHPSVTEVEEKQKRIQLNDDEYSLPVAASTVRETDSIIRARSGQIVVIGGLMQNKTNDVVQKVPLLGDIPLLGGLFRQTRKETVQSELVILIQPRIIGTQLPAERIEQLNSRYSRVLLPEW